MKRVIVSAVVIGLCVSMTFGGGVDLGDVGSSAVWAAHIDLAALRDSETGKSLMQGEDWTEFAAQMAVLKEIIGIDLSKDLNTATLYGSDYSAKENVAIIRGTIDMAKIKTVITLLKDYTSNEAGNSLVYTWTDEKKGKPVACAFHGSDTMVFAESIDVVSSSLAVLDSREASLSGTSKLRLPEAHKGAFMSFGAVEHDGRIGQRKDAAMGAQFDWISLGVGEELGKIGLTLGLGAKTDESATQIEQIVNGLKALTLMSEDTDQQTRDTLTAAKITRSGKDLAVSITGNVEDIVKMIKDGQKNAVHGQHGNSSRRTSGAGAATGAE